MRKLGIRSGAKSDRGAKISAYYARLREIMAERGCTKQEALAIYAAEKNGEQVGMVKPTKGLDQEDVIAALTPTHIISLADDRVQLFAEEIAITKQKLSDLQVELEKWYKIKQSLSVGTHNTQYDNRPGYPGPEPTQHVAGPGSVGGKGGTD